LVPIIIRPFEPRDQIAARQLILNGLGEHFGWIDETRNPDLDDIETSYIQRGHAFVVAEIDGEPIGTGGLITVDAKTARVVRMSVRRNHRRKRIGGALVTHLLDVARQRGFTRVIVATERGWDDAIGLYKHCGFTEYARDDVASTLRSRSPVILSGAKNLAYHSDTRDSSSQSFDSLCSLRIAPQNDKKICNLRL
jgi:GNAT superfamily N-acetyltransferase